MSTPSTEQSPIHARIYEATGRISALVEVMKHVEGELPDGTLFSLAQIIDGFVDDIHRANSDLELLERRLESQRIAEAG